MSQKHHLGRHSRAGSLARVLAEMHETLGPIPSITVTCHSSTQISLGHRTVTEESLCSALGALPKSPLLRQPLCQSRSLPCPSHSFVYGHLTYLLSEYTPIIPGSQESLQDSSTTAYPVVPPTLTYVLLVMLTLSGHSWLGHAVHVAVSAAIPEAV